MEETLKSFAKLLEIMDELRVKCPWDRKQTFDSLRSLTIEEVFELSDAIVERDWDKIKKELGDILLHIVFYAKMADEQKRFNIKDVIDALNEKLIFRHPHVFGEVHVSGEQEVLENWEKLKLKEKGGNKSVLAGVPKSLPSMIKAYRIQDKVSHVGFDWEKPGHVWSKVEEECNELKEELEKGDKQRAEEELGDLFYVLINAARLYGINPDDALEKANKKFVRRFEFLENKVQETGKNWDNITPEELDEFWEQAKAEEQKLKQQEKQ